MLKLKGTIRALAAAGGIAAVALASVPALASSGHAAKSITGPEVMAGTLHGKAALANAPVVPLKLSGVVATHTSINLGGSGPRPGSTKTFKTSAGKLVLKITAKPQTTQSLNPRTCREAFADYVVVTVVGAKSTGAFAGASGPGAAQVLFRAIAPRFTSGSHKGQCNPNGQPRAKGASASFLGSLVITTR